VQREDVNAIVYWDRGSARRQCGTSEDFISGSWSRSQGKSLRDSSLSFSFFFFKSSRCYCRFA